MKFINKKYSIILFVLLVFLSSSLLVFASFKAGLLEISEKDFNSYYLGLFVYTCFYNILLGVIAYVINIYIFRLFNHDIVDLVAFYNLVILRGVSTTLFSVLLVFIGMKTGVIFNIISLINPILFFVYYLFIKYYTNRGYNQKQLIRYIATIFAFNLIFNLLSTKFI